MWPRLFQAAVVLFWLGTTGSLVWRHTLPPEERMTQVHPHEPLEAFFRSNTSTLLHVYENGRHIGQITVSAALRPEDPEASRNLSFTGALEARPGQDSALASGAFWRGNLSLNAARRPEQGQLFLRLPEKDLTVLLGYNRKTGGLSAEITQQGVTLLRTQGGESIAPGLPIGMLPMLSTWSGDLMSALGLQGPESGAPGASAPPASDSGEPPIVIARRGQIPVGDQIVPAYLIRLNLPAGQWVKTYLTQPGEPLRVESSFGLELRAEPFGATAAP